MSLEKYKFQTEVNQLLDLMIHSLYSHKEIFLRELISNASDAIDRARYESLTNKEILEKDGDWKIKVSVDKDSLALTLSDNGIGMTRDEIIKELGTIAHSGTKGFLNLLKSKDVKDNPEMIGQFGVGFYSSFMVADKATVISRKAGTKDKKGVKWESSADGTFSIDDIDKENKGTDVILHLKEEEKRFLEEWEIRGIVKKYSDYIEHPIVMEVEREKESTIKKGEKIKLKEEETLNSKKALWLKDKSEITENDYNEFYKHISHDFSDPTKVIHYKAEGTTEFVALLYIPTKIPFDIYFKEFKIGPTLYVKRVQIMDHCEELLPPYLRFVKGVVDSSDLPLNVSREMLQKNPQVETIKNSLTKKVLDTLSSIKINEYDKYLDFYKEFGRVLKEGIHFDFKRREPIADLLLFQSTKTEIGKFTTLQNYIDSMREEQKEIYYITGTSYDEAAKSPYLEVFKDKDYEVLIMLDEVDDFIMGTCEYKGKKFQSVIKGEIDLDKSKDEEKKETGKKYKKLLEFIKEYLINDIKDVRLSGRLKDSACCLVADTGAMDPNMERILRSMGQEIPENKRILELNPAHPVIEAMNEVFEKDKKNPLLKDYIELLYNQALLLEGSRLKDPAAFTQSVTKLMVENTKQTAH